MADASTGLMVLLERMKAICRPSGDQVGAWSSVPDLGSGWVSRRTPVPSAFMT